MNDKKIVVAGGGVLGTQIALLSGYWGFDVTIWLRSESSITRTRPRIEKYSGAMREDIETMEKDETFRCAGLVGEDEVFRKENCLKKLDNAVTNLKLELDLSLAVKDADLVIEAMAEKADEKTAFYKKLAPLLDEKTVLATNSSTLLPSQFADVTGRPDKFLAMHFTNTIWRNNVAEVMVQDRTDKRYYDEVKDFARAIHIIPLSVNVEKNGYLTNSLLVPFLLSGLDLVANGVSDPESVDLAWVKGIGQPKGPFQIIDIVGLPTARNIVEQYQKVPRIMKPLLKKMLLPYNYKGILALLNKYIEEGKLGKASGEGFYKYN